MEKTNNPLEVTIIFGSGAVNTLYNEGILEAKEYAKGVEGMVVNKKFNTEQEMNEYFNGIADMDGWNNYAVIYSDDSF